MLEPWNFDDPNCASIDTEVFYPDLYEAFQYSAYAVKTIKNLCGSCKHQVDCLEWSLHHEGYGLWAGYSERERRVIRKQRGIVLQLPEYNLD